MEVKLIGRGHAIETAPEAWAGGVAVARVSCSGAMASDWGPSCVAVLEAEAHIGENVRPWTVAAEFTRDGERNVPLPAGRYRWRVSQPGEDWRALQFTLDVQPRPRAEKAPGAVRRDELEQLSERVSAIEESARAGRE